MRMHATIFAIGISLFIGAAGCGLETEGEPIGDSESQIKSVRSFVAKGSGYFPDSSRMEGGFVDMRETKLRTLQQFLDGQADYVSVAMDVGIFKYRQRLRIKEFNEKYGKEIVFRVVDTGGAFKGKGTSRMDICTANRKASLDSTVNGTLHVDVVDDNAAPGTVPSPTREPGPKTPQRPVPPPLEPRPLEPDVSEPRSTGCISDGACNPGNDGAGLICVAARCVPGCRTDAQCPGRKICVTSQCR
jgi:hypothetical protein